MNVSVASSTLDVLTDRVAILDTLGRIIAVNRAWRDVAHLCGAPEAKTCEGASYLEVCDVAGGAATPDAATARAVAGALRDIAAGRTEEFVADYPCHGPRPGMEAWFELRARGFDHAGQRFVSVVHSDRTRRVRAEHERARVDRFAGRLRRMAHAFRESEARLRRAQEAAGVAAFEIGPEDDIAGPPEALRVAFGWPPDTVPTLPGIIGALHAEDRPRLEAALVRLRRDGSPLHEELRLASGSRWVQLRGEADRSQGAPFRFLGAALDVTARRQAEERRELLAREVDHRAKNVLAVVQAVLTFTDAGDGARYAETLKGRVAALSRAHVLLSDNGWAGAGLRMLAAGELAPYATPGGPRVTMEGTDIALAPTAAQPLSMLLHELATNAAKHGALSRHTGHVTIAWKTDGARLRVLWRERGGPPVAPPRRRNFGSRLIATVVRHQLGGEVEQRWPPDGLEVEIDLPLGRLLAVAGGR